ncbi:MAG: UDP-N-acetylmuramoyl-L-alanyl-D-glutamate--2,6-diaminopimelate ligase [Candidatus Marinimicrobia bacterium]|nr:UDP-N-acetylmuramoyl-L-alanyl-D-glutamate--2,6-diaminopimelate ligase [Candidatus Neomarinimicrobiota bacterium]|tara:strand:+ start:1635 stop:3086 length:1452 start_codon:yes stop_codon:yes gene_type:complete
MKNSKDLMPELVNSNNFVDCEISSLHLDSREVKEGGLFFAIKGNHLNGIDFIEEARSKGAILIISEELVKDNNVVYCKNIKQLIGKFASRFYSFPSKELTTFCATGTNGKTTSVEAYAKICINLGIRCGYLSTIGKSIDGKTVKELSTITTPDPISLNKSLWEMLSNGVTHAAFEASSHGLDQGRLSGINIDYAVLTSFSQDHLDYHKSIKEYGKAKSILFKDLKPKNSFIQIDSEFGGSLYKELLKEKAEVFSVSLEKESDYSASFKKNKDSLEVSLKSPYGITEFTLSTISRYIASNVICSMAALSVQGIKIEKIAESVSGISFSAGRLESISIGKDICYIDYAHTPEALKHTLKEIRDFHEGDIWCVFGCGGNRDKEKRPIMGEIAENYSDHVIITDDNPRNESSNEIIDDILEGTKKSTNIKIIPNRREAIKFTLEEMAKRKDMNIMLLAGKGHENYQIIGSKKYRFDDKETLISLTKY